MDYYKPNYSVGIILLNIAGCIIFLALPVLFAPEPEHSLKLLTNPPTIRDFLTYALLICFGYLNYFLLIPKLYFNKKTALYICTVVFCFGLIAMFPGLLSSFEKQPFRGMPPGAKFDKFKKGPPPASGYATYWLGISHYLFIFLAIEFFSLIIRVSNRWKTAERERLNTELLYLKAQVNPHFLFNTLNSIYSLALEKSNDTPKAIVKLSSMMRYVLHESMIAYVWLKDEVDYITNYIDLQKLRFGSHVKLSYITEGSFEGKKIAPLLFIPFVENAFKYGVNAEEDSEIRIKITAANNEVKLLVTNNVVSVRLSDDPGGLGINNTKERLKLIYPGKHSLTITQYEKAFTVSLKIILL